MLVLAGPGSGKTFVITRRISHLIEQCHVPPQSILVITFTKAASIEMQQRFTKLSKDFLPVSFGTFHGIFFRILQQAYHFDDSNIITQKEKEDYISLVLLASPATDIIEEETDAEWKRLLLEEIGRVKNQGGSIENYVPVIMEKMVFCQIYKAYQQKLRQNRKLDFEDMVLLCHGLFQEHPEILEKWQEKFTYILIDEFQDINPMQYEVVRQLSGSAGNVFAVGDDDQAIYAFRGSRPELMVQFLKDYKCTGQIVLDVNYRCSGNIVEVSRALIGENHNRFQKTIVSGREAGERVVLYGFASKEEQTANVLHLLAQYAEIGQLSKVALIFRTNGAAAYYGEKLTAKQIPFRWKESLPDFYSHFIVKDILHYMEYSLTGKREDAYHIMNKPKRYLSRAAFREESVRYEDLLRFYRDKEYMWERIKRFQYDCLMLTSMNPYAAVNYIRKGIGYEGYLQKLSKEKKVNIGKWMEILDELQERAAEFESFALWKQHIQDCEEQWRLQKTASSRKGEAVSLVTMHGAKGLEYPVVIIPDINQGNIPYRKAVLPEEIEEERRIFYVAVTRAKDRLFLFYIKGKQENREQPSVFLQPLQASSSSINSSCSVSDKYSS